MPIENMEHGVPTLTMENPKEEITRQRFLELVQLGVRACQELEAHGLKKQEYCVFGRIMEQISRLG